MDNNSNNNFNKMNKINNDRSEEYNNHYKDYLPKNRYKKENGVNPKLLKAGLFPFYLAVICLIAFIALRYNGIDLLEGASRNYNINFTEAIDLKNTYNSKNVKWESDSDVVEIKNGIVTALKTGTAYLIAKENGKQVSYATINVIENNADLYLEKHDISVTTGDQVKLNVTQNSNIEDNIISFDQNVNTTAKEDDEINYDLKDNDNTEELEKDLNVDAYIDEKISEMQNSGSLVKYESSNSNVAEVKEDGTVISKAPGTAIITVTDQNGNTDHTYVNVEQDNIEISQSEYKLNKNDEVQIDFKLNSNKYKVSDIDWKSINSDIVKVDSDGKLVALKNGTATVVASIGKNIKETIEVVVDNKAILPTILEVSEKSVDLMIGATEKVIAHLDEKNLTDENLFWNSDNSDIAYVDLNGTIVGKAIGTTKVIVSTLNGLRKEIEVKVSERKIDVSNIYFKNFEITLNLNEEKELKYVIVPSNASDKSVRYEYDNNYVSINENGVIKGLKTGQTLVTIYSSNGKSSTVKVNVVDPSAILNSIKIEQGNIKAKIGETKNLLVSFFPSNITDKNIKWSSSDSSIVKIDENGKITTNGQGKAIITAVSNGVSDSIEVVVESIKKEVSSITTNIKDANVKVGKKLSAIATISPSDATNNKVIWKSSNPKIASVDENGNILALSKGKTTITAFSADNEKIKSSIDVSVANDVSVKLSNNSVSLKKGDASKINAYVSPQEEEQKVTWSSSDEKIATVDSSGKITAKKAGTVTVTGTSVSDPEAKDTCVVMVLNDPTTVKLNLESVNLNVGSSTDLVATVSPKNAENKSLTWKSSDTSIATVSAGKITAKKAGKVTISVTTVDGVTASCDVTVKQEFTDLMVSFIKTQTNITNGESVALRTSDGKIILIDVAQADATATANIISELQKLSGTSNVTIDYLFLSHYHDDHIGGLKTLLASKYITVKNLVVKQESSHKKKYQLFKNLASTYNINFIDASQFNENHVIELSKENKIHLFNVKDVYESYQDKCGGTIETLNFSTSTENKFLALADNDKYVYLKGSNPKEYSFASKVVEKKKNKETDAYFWAVEVDKDVCGGNANSLAILFEFSTKKGSKYVYIPSDLENNGYSQIGEYDSKHKTTIYGANASFEKDKKGRYKLSNGTLVPSSKDVKVPAEYLTAKNVSKAIGKSNLNNIAIYLLTHHGAADTKESIDVLNLNRSDLYAVATHSSNLTNTNNYGRIRTYYNFMSNAKKYTTAEGNVRFKISENGKVTKD